MKRIGRRHRQWFWRFRPGDAPAAYVEECSDGAWRIIIERREIARVASREIANAIVDNLDTVHLKE